MLKRGNSYSVRFNVPEDRRADVGKVFGAKSGMKDEIVRTLGTRDYREAVKRRDAALAAIRKEVNAKLTDANLPPLHGDYVPNWWAAPEKAVEAGLHYKKQIDQASEAYEPCEGIVPGTIAEGAPTSEKEHIRAVVADLVLEASEKLPPAEGLRYYNTVMGIAEGQETPLEPLAERWLADARRLVSNGLLKRHRRVLAIFLEYLDSVGVARVVQKVDKRQARRFREWLIAQGKEANTVNSYLSSLRSFWTWLDDAGEVSDSNPWSGMSGGLKKLAKKDAKARGEKRPFTDDELLLLLKGQPSSRQRAQMIKDVFRLGLLTGARQNELCSLTRGRVVVPDDPAELWGVEVTEDVSKTENSVRTIPLHPLAREIVERRLKDCTSQLDGDLDASLFPECPPGGEDNKRGWTFSKDFLRYRKAVLGDEGNGTDFQSTRRCFSTFMEVARANGVTACTDLVIDHLIGHKAERLAANTYAAKQLDWSLYSEAILGMVEKGMSEKVRAAMLDESQKEAR
ncbi:DUF6538 domain-containing protein [Acetobacter pasteurianus]|uniref:DUF6538 domain-containing protein n=1 Tax=Acetobacter TaxID=434 RepID=UPI0012D73173|nr:DUF6538 domain-containing protein [Acetobacter pasteurianus]